MRNRATPPPGKMPSSTAAQVACNALSTRSALPELDLGRAARLGVEAVGIGVMLKDLADHEGAVLAGIYAPAMLSAFLTISTPCFWSSFVVLMP